MVAAAGSTRAILAWTDGRGENPNVYAGLAEPAAPLSVVSPTGVFEAIEISPNPTSDRLTVSFTLTRSELVRIDLIDIFGRRIAVRTIEAPRSGRQGIDMDLSGVRPGIYLIRLTQGNEERVDRVCVVH